MEFSFDWLSFGLGIVSALVVFSLLLPDRWSTWLATRRNFPVVLFPLGVFALVLGVGNLIVALGGAFIKALQKTSIEPWVWYLSLAGVLIVLLFLGTKRWHKFSPRRRRVQSSQGGEQ